MTDKTATLGIDGSNHIYPVLEGSVGRVGDLQCPHAARHPAEEREKVIASSDRENTAHGPSLLQALPELLKTLARAR